MTKINKYDTIDADKASKYSAEILDSVSDISYSVSAESVAVPVKSNSRSSSGNCYEEFMETAIPLNLSKFREVTYEQLREGIWYTFTADAIDAHPGIGTGFYYIYTFGLSDTIGMLFDSSGHRLAYDDGDSTRTYRGFEIYSELEYDKTYYIYVREKDLKGGKVMISVVPMDDDHGNSMDTETYLGNVYTQNLSVSGFLHNAIDQDYHGDLDYFSFRATKDCVVEIFLENSPEAYFSLYDKNGTPVNCITYDTVNDDLRITYAIKGKDMYFVEVSKLEVSRYATDYTLNVKFVKDYSNNIIDEQYRVMYWYALNQDEYPAPLHSVTRSMVYVSNRAKYEFMHRVLIDSKGNKTLLENVLSNGTAQDILNFLCDAFISNIPVVGDSLSYAFNLGSIIYDFMSSSSLELYKEKTKETEGVNKYIIGKNYWYTDYPNGLATGNHTTYTVGSGTYYGADYQKGIFIETYIKHK